MFLITLTLYVFGLYLLVGFIFSFWFVFRGAHQLDRNLIGASFGLRLLLVPGSIGLWPFLLYKMLKK